MVRGIVMLFKLGIIIFGIIIIILGGIIDRRHRTGILDTRDAKGMLILLIGTIATAYGLVLFIKPMLGIG